MGYFNFANGTTALNDTNLNAMQKGLMELVFPIGSTYITQTNTNPNSILGFGTWERLKGKVCLGLDESDTDLATIGKTGGEKTHTLTTNEMPAHTHDGNYKYNGTHNISNTAIGSGTAGQGLIATTEEGAKLYSTSTGGGQAHNNMQPYEVVGYMWIRRS